MLGRGGQVASQPPVFIYVLWKEDFLYGLVCSCETFFVLYFIGKKLILRDNDVRKVNFVHFSLQLV